MYKRKTRDEFEIQADHGQGFELECTEVSMREAKANLRAYRENCPGLPVRVIKRRVRLEN